MTACSIAQLNTCREATSNMLRWSKHPVRVWLSEMTSSWWSVTCRMASQPVINKPGTTIRPGEGKPVNSSKSSCC